MDLFHTLYDDGYRSNLIFLFKQYLAHAYDLKVKVTDLEISCVGFVRVTFFRTIIMIVLGSYSGVATSRKALITTEQTTFINSFSLFFRQNKT